MAAVTARCEARVPPPGRQGGCQNKIHIQTAEVRICVLGRLKIPPQLETHYNRQRLLSFTLTNVGAVRGGDAECSEQAGADGARDPEIGGQ